MIKLVQDIIFSVISQFHDKNFESLKEKDKIIFKVFEKVFHLVFMIPNDKCKQR